MSTRYSPANNLERKELTIAWCLAHGLVIRPNSPSDSSAVHAPVALYPSLFPSKEFKLALELQPVFNTLYYKLSQSHEFIKVFEVISKVDEFIEQLYNIYLTVKEEGFSQPISLGIHRSDYILHSSPNAEEAHIKQVEFNTIASSFSSLSSLTSDLHRYLSKSINHVDPSQTPDDEALPSNESMTSIPRGIAKAHQLYGSKSAVVLMVVQSGERNVFDQRWIEYVLLNNHGVHLIRRTLSEIYNEGKLDPRTKALMIDGKEISVTYFRSGYGPRDHPSEKEWEARMLIERSNSIKCPTIAYQLVGSKKVQQILTVPGVLERYISDPQEIEKLRSCFTGIHPLDSSPEGEKAVKDALENPERYVMKPQREGGGNNIYAQDIPPTLSKLTLSERSSYILMDLIQPPPMRNVVLKDGEITEDDVVSELGIYGIIIGKGNEEIVNEVGGHLLRTKGRKTNEGGVATGYAVLDSPLLF
ncbi:16497_t:CDS:10 [Acaulospora morrowiae]|uniref:Glutathione synthetase n=1 Tax=Acaulospora morrowiae TaxID=94023 RepID=A0A9N9BHX7_9GLOM|nr:16497_t:CDS:10 [Acaulospora morrowiae]